MKQLSLPLMSQSWNAIMQDSTEPQVKPATQASMNYVFRTGECSQCGRPLRLSSEAQVISDKYTGRVIDARCALHLVNEWNIGDTARITHAEND